LKGRGFNSLLKNSSFGFVLKGRGFKPLRKNSGFDFVLKGRGFKPRRKCHKINPALAAEVALRLQYHFFSKLLMSTAADKR